MNTTNETVCECGHAQNEHECGLCQVVLNEGHTDGRPLFCNCPQNRLF
jgi:hypothetical protein